MHDSFTKGIPWQRFMEFISPNTDRFTMLKELIKEAALEYNVFDISGNRHLTISPPQPREEFLRRSPVILVAHYDRAEGSPGANDNSVSVFILLETAIKLRKEGAVNWMIIFTDKEELKASEGIASQGSYTLATELKKLNMKAAKIFSFDACGIGDTLVISTTLENLLKSESSRIGGGEKLRESIMELRNLALNTARNLRMEKVVLVPTPFSDDAGFFRAGIAAQTITMLPSDECSALISEIRKNHGFADALINAEMKQNSRLQSIPETWRSLNSPGDSHLRLTPQHFRNVKRFAEALCKS